MRPPQTIPEALDQAAARWPTAAAIEDGAVVLDFAALRRRARGVAGELVRRGLVPGDRVAILAPNGWAWVVAALGVHLAGGVLVPLNTRYQGPEVRDILARAGVRLVFTVEGFLDRDFAAMVGSTPMLLLPEGLGEAEAPLPTVGPDDLCDVLYTSGTTGRPKGVMCDHGQTVRAYRTWAETVGLRAGDRYLVVAPFFHCFGYKAGWLAALLAGATVLPEPVFDPARVLDRLEADRVTVLPGPPALYQALLQADPSRFARARLRLAVTGAATVPVGLVRDMRSILGFETVLTGYGLTESTGLVSLCHAEDGVETVARTSGRPIDGMEVRAVDAEGREVPPGEPGHLLVRGYAVMRGYLDDPEATAEAVVDGWLHTGDVGVIDGDGCVRVTDRIKDLFIVGGFNAYPAEIERVLLEHPAVRDVAVVGAPDARLGEVGVAFVVAEAGLDEAALIAWARERMANFKVPRRVIRVEALPRNASGKVTRFALRERARCEVLGP